MGVIWKQQGCLKLTEKQGLVPHDKLKEGTEYPFGKDGHRLYMLDIPIELITDDWTVIARVIITEITVGHGRTKGIYKVLKIYTDEESRVSSGTLIPFDKIK